MQKSTINIKGSLLNLSTPKVMGILNTTPDSFFSDSRISEQELLHNRILKMIDDGMDIVDIGGYSSRPGADDVTEKEEIKRVVNVIDYISKTFPKLPISIDTFRSKVAEKAIENGAGIINDISAGEFDKNMFNLVAETKAPYIAMHMKGTIKNMQTNPVYNNIMQEMMFYFSDKVNRLLQLGVNDIIIDPGFGFGKTVEHNYEILNNFELLHNIGLPILTGLSRKSIINKVLNTTPNQALNGTTVLNTIALLKGTQIIRVHDVKEAKQAIILVEKTINQTL
ncbi:MAG: dihydropteroate synthase [Ichthyobacteriaceae bacterium]|nr:dihydropteroate synthase [Ichthyobacteriaceae bacterium]